MTNTQKSFIIDRFERMFKSSFVDALTEYDNIKVFAPNGNINDTQQISDEAHFIMRMNTQWHLTQAFKAMKMDINDDNINMHNIVIRENPKVTAVL